MFRGRHDHTMDKKGRLSIPSGFRMELQRRSENAPILTNYRDHLVLHAASDWAQKERELLEMSELQPDVQNYQRFIVSGAVRATWLRSAACFAVADNSTESEEASLADPRCRVESVR